MPSKLTLLTLLNANRCDFRSANNFRPCSRTCSRKYHTASSTRVYSSAPCALLCLRIADKYTVDHKERFHCNSDEILTSFYSFFCITCRCSTVVPQCYRRQAIPMERDKNSTLRNSVLIRLIIIILIVIRE